MNFGADSTFGFGNSGGGGGASFLADNGLSRSIFNEVQLGQPIGAVGSPANLLSNREIPLNGNELHWLPGGIIFPSGNLALGPIGSYTDDGLGLLQVHTAGGGNAFATFRSGTIVNIFGSSANGGLIGTQSNDDVAFFSHGTQRMALKAAGYIQFTETGIPGITNFDIRQRNVSIPGPVVNFQPSGNAGFPNANIAMDIMPKGSPGDYLTNGTAWIDVCNTDCQASNVIPVGVARLASFSDHAYVGSGSFAGYAVMPLVLGVNLLEVGRFDTSGFFGVNASGLTLTSQVDINGANGFAQLRLRTSYTPTGSADPNGNPGDFAWDGANFYIKTGPTSPTAWKKTALVTF